ncbi:MAG: hypothetical protein U1F76_24855 [Candidatus Competibacteraceae bacterium]
MKRLAHSLGLCVLLAACGGGGGGGNGGGNDNGGDGSGVTCTPESGKLLITNDNADTVSSEAYDATTAIPHFADLDYVYSVLFVTPVISQSTNSLLAELPEIVKDGLLKKHPRSDTNLLRTLNSDQTMLPYSIIGPVTVNCPNGGSYNLQINDADNDGRVSAGDIITFNFSNCQIVNSQTNAQGVFNGQLITALVSVTSNSLVQFPFKATFTHNAFIFQVTSTALSQTIREDGDITATFSCTASNCQIFDIKAEGINLAETQTSSSGSTVASWRVTNYVTESDFDNNSQETTYSGNGTLYIDPSSGNAVSFATTASNPFKESAADQHPYAGEEVSTGACNSSVKLDVIDNQNVTVAVDPNGDGVYETTNNMTWSTLLQSRQ